MPPRRAPAGRWPTHHSARVTARQGTARRDAQLRVAAGTESSCSRSCGLSIAHQEGPFGTAPRTRPPLWMPTPDMVSRHRKRHFPCQLPRMVLCLPGTPPACAAAAGTELGPRGAAAGVEAPCADGACCLHIRASSSSRCTYQSFFLPPSSLIRAINII